LNLLIEIKNTLNISSKKNDFIQIFCMKLVVDCKNCNWTWI